MRYIGSHLLASVLSDLKFVEFSNFENFLGWSQDCTGERLVRGSKRGWVDRHRLGVKEDLQQWIAATSIYLYEIVVALQCKTAPLVTDKRNSFVSRTIGQGRVDDFR
jgi:hypothetical protein